MFNLSVAPLFMESRDPSLYWTPFKPGGWDRGVGGAVFADKGQTAEIQNPKSKIGVSSA